MTRPNLHDFRAVVQGIEQAEARGDHVTAERLLRQALALQEASVGPNHPEVANILNNLAIVCELNGKLTDAEACYRRSYAIATASFPANDPFVTTSRENLEQFCAARGVSFRETPPVAASPAPTASSAPGPAASSVPPPRPAPPPPPPKMPAAAPKAAAPPPPRAAAPPSLDDFPLRSSSAVPVSPRTLSAPAATREPSRAPGIAAALTVLLLLLVSGWYLFYTNPSGERTASTPPASPGAAPPPAPSPVPAEPTTPQLEPAAPEAAAAAPTPAPEPVAPPTPAPAAPEPVAPERPGATTGTSSTTVLIAEVCRSLTRTGEWTCAPATGAQDPGLMYFYTRVASPRDTTIEHRWYRDDRLEQRVPLRIRANPSGFRTYSQRRISADRAGKWKVELRTQDGQLLDEQMFVVRR